MGVGGNGTRDKQAELCSRCSGFFTSNSAKYFGGRQPVPCLFSTKGGGGGVGIQTAFLAVNAGVAKKRVGARFPVPRTRCSQHRPGVPPNPFVLNPNVCLFDRWFAGFQGLLPEPSLF